MTKTYAIKPTQISLANIFNTWGISGCCEHLKKYAEKEERDKSAASWQKYLKQEGELAPRYMRSMNQSVLRAMIEGNLPAKERGDAELRRNIEKHHLQQNVPQIYVSFVSRKEFGGQSQGTPTGTNAGTGPSLWELEKAARGLKRYLTLGQEGYATEVDRQFPGLRTSGDSIDGRKYSVTKKAVEVMLKWAEDFSSEIFKLRKNSPNTQHQPLDWSLSEVGWSIQGHKRAMQHVQHEATNYLFGAFTAVLEKEFPRMFEIRSYTVMDVSEPGHANFCEVLASMLLGSYCRKAGFGLNPTLAGGESEGTGKRGLNRPELDGHWIAAQNRVASKRTFDESEAVETKKLKKAKTMQDVVRRNSAVVGEVATLEAERDRLDSELEARQAKVDKKSALADLLRRRSK